MNYAQGTYDIRANVEPRDGEPLVTATGHGVLTAEAAAGTDAETRVLRAWDGVCRQVRSTAAADYRWLNAVLEFTPADSRYPLHGTITVAVCGQF